MAASSVLAVGTTAADSSDITVVAGTPVTVVAKGASGGDKLLGTWELVVKVKGDDGVYYPIDSLNKNKKGVILAGPGVYQVSRLAGSSVSVGVFVA